MRKYKLAILTSHPIQYQVPLFKKLAEHKEIDLTVYFCWDFGVEKEKYDPGFGREIKWDIPLLEGFNYKFLTNFSPKPNTGFLGHINPGIIKELIKNKYDAILIHGYAYLSNWLGFIGAWLSKTPILLRGESHLLTQRIFWKRAVKYPVLFLLFKEISAFLTIGSLNKEYYKNYGVADEKLFLTPYAVNNEFFLENYKSLYQKRNEIKEKLGINKESPIILYASKMMPRKRAMDLLKAYEKIQETAKAVLLFVGDGIEKPLLEIYTKKQNLKNVYFAGFKNQSELPQYYAIADIFVLPSTDEPWGLVINEAMNFALPIITTNKVGASPDLVRHGENGFIYSVGDIETLANYLKILLNDSTLRKKMGHRSLEIISKWNYEENIKGILSALKCITNK